MKRILLITTLIFVSLNFSGCANKHGISAKYYSDCEEYYDMQGYYHKKCGDDDIVTYKVIGDGVKNISNSVVESIINIYKEEEKRGSNINIGSVK